MAGYDWNATGAMIGGIGSIVAVGVAIVLSELQHRRTIRLVERQDAKAAGDRDHETRMLALWVASVLFDLRVKAAAVQKPYASIKIETNDVYFPPEAAEPLGRLINGFALGFDTLSPRILDVLPRFTEEAGTHIIPVLRRARHFDVRNNELALLASAGGLQSTSLLAGLKRQVDVLERIRESCDMAYTALSEHYGFEPLAQQLASLEASNPSSTI